MSSSVPFVDLRAQHEQMRSEIEAAIKDIIDRSMFIGGSYLTTFEQEFAAYLGVHDAIGVANGTDALWLGLVAAGVKPGDAVITVPNTFIATVEAITRAGAYPLFVDIDLSTANMSPEALKAYIESDCFVEDDGSLRHIKTGWVVSAVMPVHLYGLPADMTPILSIANQYGLIVIEDACQGHGARYKFNGKWVRVGSMGKAAGFSFYPGKNLGAMGDGGAVVTNDPEMAVKIRWLRDHGQSEKYIHITADGWNSRLDTMQAAILSAKLKKLDEWNASRRRAAAYYQNAMSELHVELPCEPDHCEHVYHLYVIRTNDRDQLKEGLSAQGIGTGLHYPIPLHLQKAYAHLGYLPGSFPNSENSANTGLSLPMHPALTETQIDWVAEAVKTILTGNRVMR